MLAAKGKVLRILGRVCGRGVADGEVRRGQAPPETGRKLGRKLRKSLEGGYPEILTGEKNPETLTETLACESRHALLPGKAGGGGKRERAFRRATV